MAGSDAQSSVAGRRSRLIIGGWLVDPDRCTLQSGQDGHGFGENIRVSPRSMDVLLYLARHQGEVINTRELLDAFWHPASATDHAVHNAIASLRSALDDDPHNPRFIRTLPKRGYRLIAEVRQVRERPSRYRDAIPLLAGLATTVVLLFAGLVALGWVDRSGAGQALHPPVSSTGTQRLAVQRPGYPDAIEADSRLHVDALWDALVTRVGARPDLEVMVIERPSPTTPAAQAAHLLKSRLYTTGNTLRLTVNLTETSGTSLYLDHFVLDSASLPAAGGEVVPTVVAALDVHLDKERRQRMLALGTADAAAFRHYQQAEYLRSRNHHRAWQQAMEQYERAIGLDPRFVQAYVGKAATARDMARYSRYERGLALGDEIRVLARRLTLEVPDNEALERLGMMRMIVTGFDEWQQERIYRERIRSGHAPSYLYTRYATLLAGARLYREAEAYLRLAREQADTTLVRLPGLSAPSLMPQQRAAEQMRRLAERPADIGLLGAAIRNLVLADDLDRARRLLDRLRQHDGEGIRTHLSRILVAGRAGVLSPTGAHGGLFHAGQLEDPDLAFNNGILFFLRGDFERGAGYWRELSPTDRHRLFTERHVLERHLPDSIRRDPRYAGLLNELGAGNHWRRHLMAGVRELAPHTGVAPDRYR